jgi:hypothetical protein
METLIIVMLAVSAATSFALGVTLLPLLWTMSLSTTELGRVLFKFLRGVTVTQVLSSILPTLLLLTILGWIGPDASTWIFLVTSGILLIENMIITFYAFHAFKVLKGRG